MADTYRPGQLVRIRARLRADRAGYVDHVTKTQVVLRTGERFSRKTGRLWGAGVSTTRIEPWDARKGGFCVKAGQASFKLLLDRKPDVYARHEAEEETLRQHLGKDVAVMRDRSGGEARPLTMRAFRERIQGGAQLSMFDAYDYGACSCLGAA